VVCWCAGWDHIHVLGDVSVLDYCSYTYQLTPWWCSSMRLSLSE
jgi:hypothetical protein